MLKRLAYAIAVGLVGAGIVHITILMMLPTFSARDAWSRLATLGDLYEAERVVAGGPVMVQPADPFFLTVACRFDLHDGIAHLTADGSLPFWSASIYDRHGQNIYSFNDRTTSDNALDFVIAAPLQMIELRKNLPADLETAVFVEADIDEGIVMVRAFAPDPSIRPGVEATLDGLTCVAE
ncbi:DUF1254 domain-containing protein [Mesorhizobium sp. NBSH29]|uniref:DUF1254 domain-containing protein n=1 Tax=Mesorhizobium sp. NBSH29 TaxID=2654249 RepID=UPI00189652C8|nr:DUF1254 domain-containing protein [Mesorhizobium sp. NBSH29]QPC87200.1 DUF1254 domain-containing protein [Mesorhizobium sp. NBSH29]